MSKVKQYTGNIDLILKSLPHLPGVYQFLNKNGEIIYIGKAKDLKKRVSSYFTKKHESGKIKVLTGKIADIQHILVESESDALLLENNLIKKYQPRYNVMLKDDKTFPWICIKNEDFPRIFSTRKIVKDGSVYFGPYTSAIMVKTILELIKQLYKIRTCNLKLTEKNIKRGNFRVCLEYHIGNCKAPCVGKQLKEEYESSIKEIKGILRGNISTVAKELKTVMIKLSEEQKYEEAQEVKERLQLIEKYKSKSTIVSRSVNNVDVFSIIEDDSYSYVNYLKVIEGAIVQSHSLEIKKKLEEKPEDILSLAITEIRQKLFSNSNVIIVPFNIDYSWPDTKVAVPKRGDKKRLLELSQRNVKYYMKDRQHKHQKINPKKHTDRVMQIAQKDLGLKQLPVHIECFDNSNIHGSVPVSACVVYRNARPSKNEYRHYNIKTVKGANDFASIEEVVFRRYKRLISEKKELPQLIIIDGGKGQLNSALKALSKLKIKGKIPVIGIAKKLEKIYLSEDPVPLYLDKTSETLKLIQQLRNEAHRFSISFHRKKRIKDHFKSDLYNISGLGIKTFQLLLAKFKSVENISNAKLADLQEVVGNAKAKAVFDYFNN